VDVSQLHIYPINDRKRNIAEYYVT